jgi:hypothetical protein
MMSILVCILRLSHISFFNTKNSKCCSIVHCDELSLTCTENVYKIVVFSLKVRKGIRQNVMGMNGEKGKCGGKQGIHEDWLDPVKKFRINGPITQSSSWYSQYQIYI